MSSNFRSRIRIRYFPDIAETLGETGRDDRYTRTRTSRQVRQTDPVGNVRLRFNIDTSSIVIVFRIRRSVRLDGSNRTVDVLPV